MTVQPQVEIVEVSPRDGLQNESARLTTAQKVDLVGRLMRAGARRIEVASFVDPRRVPAMADAEAVVSLLPRQSDLVRIGLALNRRGVQRALACGVDEINYGVSATESFARRNANAGREELLRDWPDIAADARAGRTRVSVTVSVAFGCPFSGEVSEPTVADIVARLLDAAAPDEIALADTIGVAVPAQVRRVLTATIEQTHGRIPLRAHFHNTRNTGYANALAAVESGVRVLDASAGGIGGCPFAPGATGNIATEDLVYLLHRSGIWTGIDLRAMSAVGTWLADALGREAPALLGRAGPFPQGADQ